MGGADISEVAGVADALRSGGTSVAYTRCGSLMLPGATSLQSGNGVTTERGVYRHALAKLHNHALRSFRIEAVH